MEVLNITLRIYHVDVGSRCQVVKVELPRVIISILTIEAKFLIGLRDPTTVASIDCYSIVLREGLVGQSLKDSPCNVMG